VHDADPERSNEDLLDSSDGRKIFESILSALGYFAGIKFDNGLSPELVAAHDHTEEYQHIGTFSAGPQHTDSGFQLDVEEHCSYRIQAISKLFFENDTRDFRRSTCSETGTGDAGS